MFWKAVDNAVENALGLVEASEVIEPNLLILNATRSFANLLNSHPDGALLYKEAALQQTSYAREMIVQEKLHLDEVNKMLRKPGDTSPFAE